MSIAPEKPLSDVERIKAESNFLRGTIVESLADRATGAIADDDTQLSKFHGIYQQDDRDIRDERRRRKLEPLHSFMIRVRVPGGIVTPSQWLALDDLADRYANGTLRITTRQAVQYHGVTKRELKTTMAAINASLLDTLAACGDVNRNVMCSPNPVESIAHAEVQQWAARVSEGLTPATGAYHEIWLDGEKVVSTQEEPLYGATYLPRKFKIAFAVPPDNDVDVFAHDLGFIAVIEDGALAGFDVTVGGGMGMTHGEPATFPRLGDVIGFCTPDQVLAVAEQVVAVQRDFGDRTDRKHARLKYTIEDRGVDWFRAELERRLGWQLAAQRPYLFTSTGDRYGWTEGADGLWHLTLFIENGRVADTNGVRMRTGLRELAAIHSGEYRLTPNQNLIVAGVPAARKADVDALVERYGLKGAQGPSLLRMHSMACVALPTCSQSMAEAERYLPDFITLLEGLLDRHGLWNEAISVRMTGCPNGCARPYISEIGLVGKAPGKYNLYLGGSATGERLNRLYGENIGEGDILAALDAILERFAAERADGEAFGEFVVRAGFVRAVAAGSDFHTDPPALRAGRAASGASS